jgi:hypothetical protein
MMMRMRRRTKRQARTTAAMAPALHSVDPVVDAPVLSPPKGK